MLSSGLGASLKSGGFNAIRYPGGSYTDIFNFISGSNQKLNDGAYFAPGDTFNNFMSTLVAPSGAKPVITVNYGSNVNDNGPALPSTAASWGAVRQRNKPLWDQVLGDRQRSLWQWLLQHEPGLG